MEEEEWKEKMKKTTIQTNQQPAPQQLTERNKNWPEWQRRRKMGRKKNLSTMVMT